nr:unnamed protein product [Digitaria exilis]
MGTARYIHVVFLYHSLVKYKNCPCTSSSAYTATKQWCAYQNALNPATFFTNSGSHRPRCGARRNHGVASVKATAMIATITSPVHPSRCPSGWYSASVAWRRRGKSQARWEAAWSAAAPAMATAITLWKLRLSAASGMTEVAVVWLRIQVMVFRLTGRRTSAMLSLSSSRKYATWRSRRSSLGSGGDGGAAVSAVIRVVVRNRLRLLRRRLCEDDDGWLGDWRRRRLSTLCSAMKPRLSGSRASMMTRAYSSAWSRIKESLFSDALSMIICSGND